VQRPVLSERVLSRLRLVPVSQRRQVQRRQVQRRVVLPSAQREPEPPSAQREPEQPSVQLPARWFLARAPELPA
jgi:hypothetical protein